MPNVWCALAVGLVVSSGCGKPEQTSQTGAEAGAKELPLVAFAQANSQDPWRQVFDADTKAAAEQYASEFRFEEQEAQDDSAKQIAIIENFLIKKPKVLLVSPVTEAVQSAIEKAMNAGVPVILLDRSAPGENWTAYVGGDNLEIGRRAGRYMAEQLGGKGTILMIQGIAGAAPTRDRANGFLEVMKENPGIEVIMGDDCKYQRNPAQTFMQNFLTSGRKFDAVYAHNDEMAIGAYLAMEAAKSPKKLIVGIDGCQREVIEMIKEGKLSATFKYPQPGPKAVELAAEIIRGTMPDRKRYLLETEMVTQANADAYLAANPNLAR
jgi:ribose transport system substrate-binding protein